MPKMRAVQLSRAGGPLEMVEREIPAPGPGEVRVRVQANGICHSDVLTKEGLLPGIQYPRVPGHEIAGVVDAPFAALRLPQRESFRSPGLAKLRGVANK